MSVTWASLAREERACVLSPVVRDSAYSGKYLVP